MSGSKLQVQHVDPMQYNCIHPSELRSRHYCCHCHERLILVFSKLTKNYSGAISKIMERTQGHTAHDVYTSTTVRYRTAHSAYTIFSSSPFLTQHQCHFRVQHQISARYQIRRNIVATNDDIVCLPLRS